MPMDSRKKAAVAGGIAAIIGGSLAYYLTRPSVAVPPPPPEYCNAYTIDITGSTVVDTGIAEDYTVTVDYNGSPLTSTVVTLTEQNTSFTSTAITNSSGQVTFSVTFSSGGIYNLLATVDGCSSSSLTVSVNVPCPSGQIRYLGVCTPATISLVVSSTLIIGVPANFTFTATILSTAGQAISNYNVTLTDTTTGVTAEATTGSNGSASFDVTINTPGNYVFEASA